MGTLNRIFKNRIAIRIEKDTMQYWSMGHQWSLLADIYIYIYLSKLQDNLPSELACIADLGSSLMVGAISHEVV